MTETICNIVFFLLVEYKVNPVFQDNFIRLIRLSLSIVLRKEIKIFVGENLPRINFQKSIPTLKSEKEQGKVEYSWFFCYSYPIDSPLQKRDFIFLRNKYFRKD